MRPSLALVGGALGGACAAVIVVWFLGAHPGRAQEDLESLRLALAEGRVRQASALASIEERVRSLEERTARAPVDTAARSAADSLASDLQQLRAAVRLELVSVDTELRRITALIDGVIGVAGGTGGTDPGGPLPEEDEPRFVVRAGDADPGVRFSALVRLGRRRSDRSVQVSLARLSDRDDSVVWIALHNLGGFQERDAAPDIAALLDHSAALVRQKAHDTLVRLGAPADTGFEALDPPEVRELGAARLRAWSEES